MDEGDQAVFDPDDIVDGQLQSQPEDPIPIHGHFITLPERPNKAFFRILSGIWESIS